MSFIGKLQKQIKNRGAHTGLDMTSNSAKMAAYIVAPFLLAWFLLQVFVPYAQRDIFSLVSFVGWIAYIVMLYAKTKADAAGYMPFPQAHFFYPDGQQMSYDIVIPPNGYEKIADYEDGSKLYRVSSKDKLGYQEADRPNPDIFNKMLWKLPTEWNDTFKRNGHGEFFFQNLFISHPACENIEVSVIDWEEMGAVRLPICLITGCSYFFEEAKKSGGKELPNPEKRQLSKVKKGEAVIQTLKEEIRELRSRNGFLESEAEQYTKKEPRSIKELSDKRISRIRDEVGDITDTGLNWKQWLIVNGKYIAYALVILGITAVVSHLVFGFP